MIRGVVFDLDDTLYPERDYAWSGFDHVARTIGRSPAEIAVVANWLHDAFESGRRGDTFDGLFAAFPDLAQTTTVMEVVDAYRGHAPAIALDKDVEVVLDRLRDRGLRLGIVSDGPLASQSAKVVALALSRWFDPIVLTDALGPGSAKPSAAGFDVVAQRWSLPGPELAYVADNPAKDFSGPRRLGWRTIRVRHPGQLHWSVEPATDADRPDVERTSIAGVIDALG